MRKGQGRRPLLGVHGLRALRRHRITHLHDSVIDITKWAQEYFQKPLSVNTIRRAICRCQLNLYNAKRKPYVYMVQKCRRVLWANAHLKWTVPKWKIVLWSDESKFDILVGNHGCLVLQAKEDRDLSACYQRRFFLNQCRTSILLCDDLNVTLLCVKHNLLQVFLKWWVKSAVYAAQKWVAWPFWEGRGLYTAKETISSTKKIF